MKVFQAINAVSAQLAREGIGKGGKNQQQGYAFRGIDQVMNGLAPVLASNKLIVSPRVISRECEPRQTKSGGVLYSVAVMVEFDFISAEDGSKHTACMAGEGMDSADKATNKAVASAYKYVVCQTFCIPLEGSADADLVTPEETVMEDTKPAPAPQKTAEVHPLKTGWLEKTPAKPSISARAQAARVAEPIAAKIEHPTAKDSAAVLKLMLFALENCETREHALAFSNNNGQKSEKWGLLVKADQDALMKAVKAKFTAITASEKAAKSVANA